MALKSLRPWDNNTMKRYLRIYKALIKINASVILAYRTNFLNQLFSTFAWGAFNFVWIVLLTSKAKMVFGWQGDELVIISIGYIIITGVYYTLCAHNFENFSRIIDRGEFDTILLKPLDTQFQISLLKISYASFIRTIFGTGLLIWWVTSHHFNVGIFQALGFVALVAIGVIMMYAFWFICITILFWFPNLNNMVELLYTINGFVRYPVEMLKASGLTPLLIFIPLSLIISTPVKVLLQKNAWGDIGLLFVLCTILLFLSRIFWNFALKSYTSAS